MSTEGEEQTKRLMLICFLWLVSTSALVNSASCYARVYRVEVYASSPVQVGEPFIVQTTIYTGNNVRERVTEVEATLIMPEKADLVSGVNPVFIGEMGPGPAHTSCNWTLTFLQPGIYDLEVNVSCLDTQDMARWMVNSTTVIAYGFPHVEFTYSNNLYVDETVTFDASKSYAVAPGGWIVHYQWDFGDGTKIVTEEAVVEHMFKAVGDYSASLNVTDSRGLSNVTTTNLRINLLGDVNLDNKVDILDVALVANSYRSRPGEEGWSKEYDLNKDGVIDILDISLVAKKYGTSA